MGENERQKEEKIRKYLKENPPEWEDLSEGERRVVSFIYSSILVPTHRDIMPELSKLGSQIEAIDERLPSAIQKIDSIEEFTQQNKLAIVDFFSTWCTPCYQLEPALERVAREGNGVAVGKINLDEHKEVVKKYDASALPLLVSFRVGEVVQRMWGAPTDPGKRFDQVRWMTQRLEIPDEEYEKTLKRIRLIARAKGWNLNPNENTVTGLVAALAFNERKFGRPMCPCKSEKDLPENICPCRRVEGKYLGAEKRIERNGICFCGLFCSPEYARQHEEALSVFKVGV